MLQFLTSLWKDGRLRVAFKSLRLEALYTVPFTSPMCSGCNVDLYVAVGGDWFVTVVKSKRSSWSCSRRLMCDDFDKFFTFRGSNCPNYTVGQTAVPFTQQLCDISAYLGNALLRAHLCGRGLALNLLQSLHPKRGSVLRYHFSYRDRMKDIFGLFSGTNLSTSTHRCKKWNPLHRCWHIFIWNMSKQLLATVSITWALPHDDLG